MRKAKVTTSFKRALPWYLLALGVIVLDQLTKYWAASGLENGHSVVVTSFFNLTLAHNTGAAFSLLHDAGGWQRWFFALIAGGVGVALVIWLARLPRADRLLALALGLVLGGALGNLCDRLALGYVIDFIVVHYEHYYFPAFNVADSAITVGAVLLVWESFFGNKSDDESDGEAVNE